MKLGVPISVALAIVALAAHSHGQDSPSDHVLGAVLQRETDAINREHSKARLFQLAIVDFVPAAIGVDCSASMTIASGFLSEGNSRYYEVSGQFSACNGSLNSSLRISERTYRTVPCKPRYAEQEPTKSCGGPLDEPEPEELHRPLEFSPVSMQKIFDMLREKGLDLSYRYDLQMTTAARMTSKVTEFEIPAGSESSLFRFRFSQPDATVVFIRGRQSKSPGAQTAFAVVDAKTASIIDIGHSTPLNLLPPARRK